MKYSLEIIQQSGGEKTTVQVPAEGEYKGGTLILSYDFDDAPYRLEISQNAVTQSRGGAFRLSMRFEAGKTTTARLSDGINGGEFPLETQNLKVVFDGSNVKAECVFSFGGGDGATVLTIEATLLQ